MTQLSLLEFTPQNIPDAARAEEWHIIDLYNGSVIAGPFHTPEDAMTELDELDPEAIRFRLAFRPSEEI